ncbi:RlmE family RNA methyltransferase [Spirochaeta isovalerica]|uniref:Ribosomal RNA large subunit methyltransferase E n=1 Tax=Spirochaeta isovalerica TaxID=150 RepID=A0A841RFT9_9SPIO|nr:RlmE family RNA methyltransferase [Spirochaeta isovalerica]MBB6482087.1 23S rRNA (uridine2552-2'-O)-methyltransferase [Spirochaeta isovalerica]
MAKREKPDFYAEKARKEGYPARSVYKLEEIQKKFNIIRPGYKIIDVGASPGSWTMYALQQTKGQGLVVGADLKPMGLKKSYPNFFFMQGDIFEEETIGFLAEKGPYDTILSDAAPSTTGNRTIDTGRSYSLVERIIGLADPLLKKGGSMVVKIFQGGDEKDLLEYMRTLFASVKILKPKAVRKESFETYFIGLEYKGTESE